MNAEPTTPELVAMLYARHPDIFNTPKRPWVGLTGLEQKELMTMSAREAVFATEAKLKELNK